MITLNIHIIFNNTITLTQTTSKYYLQNVRIYFHMDKLIIDLKHDEFDYTKA